MSAPSHKGPQCKLLHQMVSKTIVAAASTAFSNIKYVQLYTVHYCISHLFHKNVRGMAESMAAVEPPPAKKHKVTENTLTSGRERMTKLLTRLCG